VAPPFRVAPEREIREEDEFHSQQLGEKAMRRQKMLHLVLGGAIGLVLAVAGRSAAAQPVSVNVFSQVRSSSNQVDNTVFTIPVGKRLVIEYVSARATVPSGQTVSAIHLNIPIVHFFVVAAQGTTLSGDEVFTAAQSLRTTVGPFRTPMDVVVRAERNAFESPPAILDVTLAGQLID
jgi:hypothetical protein